MRLYFTMPLPRPTLRSAVNRVPNTLTMHSSTSLLDEVARRRPVAREHGRNWGLLVALLACLAFWSAVVLGIVVLF